MNFCFIISLPRFDSPVFFLCFPPGNDKGLFDIDKSSGNITVNGTIDAEKTEFFRITVKVIWIHLMN